MNFDRVVRLEPDLDLEHVAGVNDTQAVRRPTIKSFVMKRQRLTEDRAGVAAPRPSPVSGLDRTRSSVHGMRQDPCRTKCPPQDAAAAERHRGHHKTRPDQDWSSSRSRRSRPDAPARCRERIAANRPSNQSRLLSTWSIVSSVAPGRRRSPCTDVRSIACECSETMPPPARKRWLAGRPRPAASPPDRESPRLAEAPPVYRSSWPAQPIKCPLFEVGFVDQATAHIGVVIAVESLLEPPVGQNMGRDSPFERSELLERRLHRAVG